jgi:uncharacterized protein YbjQ (UPF0145 family)
LTQVHDEVPDLSLVQGAPPRWHGGGQAGGPSTDPDLFGQFVLGKDILAGLKTLFGGEIEEYTKLMAESREQALDRMRIEAESLGANAILEVRFTTSMVMSLAAEILVFGTAVVIERES